MVIGIINRTKKRMNDKTSEIWENFYRELKRFVENRISNKSHTDDILQEVFIKIHNNIETLKDEAKIKSWIYQITRNTIIDFFRNLKKHSDDFPEVNFFENIDEEGPRDRIAISIKELIDNLPEKYKEAITLTEIEGLNQKELSERLGISLSGAKSRVQRARQMVKDELMNCCHYEFDKYGTLVDYHPITCCCCKRHPEYNKS